MNDIFISYAHLDDKPLTEGQKGWITKFHRILEVRLGQLLGEEPTIWRDPKLSGNDVFDQSIVGEFKKARVMLSIMTPRYVKSDWCVRELSGFIDAAAEEGQLQVDDKSRVFKVVKTPIAAEEVPDKIRTFFDGLLGFQFYDLDPDTGRVMEFDDVFGKEAEQNYYARIFDLAHELSDLLKRLRAGSDGETAQNSASTGKTVYLATTTSESEPERDKLKRELLERGYDVLPNASLPLELGAIEERVRDDMEQSDLVLHIVGQRYGMVPENSEESIPVIQARVASELDAENPVQRVVWFPHGMITDDKRQAEYIQSVREDRELNQKADVIADELDVVRNTILDMLKEEAPPESETAAPASGATALDAKSSVYLIYDATDEEQVEPLEDYLFDQGLEVMVPEFEGGEEHITKVHRDKLARCDAALIYFGKGTRAWVETKLMDLMQAPGYGREKEWLAKSVYVGPPEDRRKKRFKTHFAELIQAESAFDQTLVEPFVNSLKTN